MLTLRDLQDSIMVQDACNLSGVAHSFVNMIAKVRQQLREQGKEGTDNIAHHPVIQLFAYKIFSLSFGECLCKECGDKYVVAYEAIREDIKGYDDKTTGG